MVALLIELNIVHTAHVTFSHHTTGHLLQKLFLDPSLSIFVFLADGKRRRET